MYFCNSGVVYLDYNLMKCSEEFIDTVILHELVHSICKNHDKRFYETMSRYGTERAVAVDKENIGYNGNREL
jgi:predicted metal-dependent hydrolase